MTTINLPFFVFETLHTLNRVLEVVFRSNPENNTYLSRVFIPRKIEMKKVEPRSDGSEFADKIAMWANGVYVYAVSEGYSDTRYGDQHHTMTVQIKVRRYGCRKGFLIFEVPLDDVLFAEMYRERIETIEQIPEPRTLGGDEEWILGTKARQEAALRVIRNLLAS